VASETGIRTTWAVLRAAGLAPPWSETERPGSVWLDLLADVTDERLLNLTKAYVLSDARFWPTPGQLLATRLPRIAPIRPQIEDHDDPYAAWCGLEGDVRMAVLGQAIDETERCSPSCRVTCPSCTSRTLARAEQLARLRPVAA
jgi:hypothetical protein